MKMRSLFAAVFVFTVSAAIVAQPSDANKPAVKSVASNAKTEKDSEAERILRERRENARSLLLNLAAEAARFNDQTLRARTQARIADVLWSADPERAKALFRKAWDSAETIDQESQRKLLEDLQKQKSGNSEPVHIATPPNIRGEVLRLAAKHDRALGEEFLTKLNTQTAQDATASADRLRNNPLSAPDAVSQRLTLARQLLDTDVARALQFADPALTTLTREGIDFLSYLREKDAAAADMRYASYLPRLTADLQFDANTVSMLSSYLFTPHIYVTFSNNGASSSQTSRQSGPPNVSPDLRAAFFRAAGDVLLRPLAPPGQDQTSAGVQGKYLMLKRLGPLFDQFAPREMAEAVHAQADALAQGLPDDVRGRDDDTVREGIREQQSPEEREKALQDRIDRAKTAEERDALYIQMARLYVDKGDMRARDFTEKIEDQDLRNKVRPYIDGSLAFRAIDKKDVDLVFDILKKGDLPHFHRSWALIQTAKLLAKTDRERALSTLEEATVEAKRIEESDADRPRALTAIANALYTIDHAKGWDAVSEAVKAANGAESFTGEDGIVRLSLLTKTGSSVRNTSSSDFNVASVFSELAKEDYNKTVEVIRGYEREAPRASATIAIAKTILEDKKN